MLTTKYHCLAAFHLLSWMLACSPTLAISTQIESKTIQRHVSSERSIKLNVIVKFDSRLRSAFLQRHTGMDRVWKPASIEEQVFQLQEHFNAVIELLESKEEQSLYTALNRLQKMQNRNWTEVERLMWHDKLQQERLNQVATLSEYRDRGRFPINEHVAGRAVPVFIDNYQTDCAVGHLMRVSGHGAITDYVSANSNLVYVTDINNGPVLEWIATSGLTQEEAALIQPGYGGPRIDAYWNNLEQGEAIEHGRLIYSHFNMDIFQYTSFGEALLPIFGPDSDGYFRDSNGEILEHLSPYSNIDTSMFFEPVLDPQDNAYAAIGNNRHSAPCCGYAMTPHFGDWFFNRLDLNHSFQNPLWIQYSFVVQTTSEDQFIRGGAVTSQPIFNFNRVSDDESEGTIHVTTKLTELSSVYNQPVFDGVPASNLPIIPIKELGTMNMGLQGFFAYGNEHFNFESTRAIRVETMIYVSGNAEFDSIIHSFDVIPEPSSATLLLCSTIAAVLPRKMRQVNSLTS